MSSLFNKTENESVWNVEAIISSQKNLQAGVKIPTKQQKGQNINTKSSIEIASFKEENTVSRG